MGLLLTTASEQLLEPLIEEAKRDGNRNIEERV